MRIDKPELINVEGHAQGNRVLISETTIAPSTAIITFTLAGFSAFEIVGTNIIVSADDSEIDVFFSDDGGATAIDDATSYEAARLVNNSTEGGQDAQGSIGTDMMTISNTNVSAGIGTNTGEGAHFIMQISNVHQDSGMFPLIQGFVSMIDATSRPSTSRFAGMLQTVQTVNAILIESSGGTFESGSMQLFGVS